MAMKPKKMMHGGPAKKMMRGGPVKMMHGGPAKKMMRGGPVKEMAEGGMVSPRKKEAMGGKTKCRVRGVK